MDAKATLKKLHERMPNLSIDELITILDCYVEYEFHTYRTTTDPWIYDKQTIQFTGTGGTSSDKCINGI